MFKRTGLFRVNTSNKLLITVLVALFILPVRGYTQADQQQSIFLYQEADKLYNLNKPSTATDKQAIANFLLVAHSSDENIQYLKIESLIKAGNIYLGYKHYDSCKLLYHKALAQNKRNRNKLAYNYEAYLYLGSSMYLEGILDSAQYYFELASNIAEKYNGTSILPEQDRLYNSLGAMYYEAANFKEAKTNFETALYFAAPQKDKTQEFLNTIRSNIAKCLLKMHRYDDAIALLRSLKPKGDQQSIIQQNLANAYFEKGSYDSAMLIYEQEKNAGNDLSIMSLNNIGRMHASSMSWQKAQAAFNLALQKSRQQLAPINNQEEALTYLYLSELSSKLGRYEDAINFANEALIEVHFNFKPSTRYDIPAKVEESVSPIILYQIIIFKANLIYQKYRSNRDQNLLLAAHQTYIKAVETSNLIARTLDNDDAKLFFLDNAKKLFTQAIQVAYEATKINTIYIEDYIYILEHYKGNILQQNLEQLQLKTTSNIPAQLLEKEYALKQMYAVYLSKMSKANNKNELVQIQKKLNSFQIELSGIQRQYKGYRGSKWISRLLIEKSIPIKVIQKNIGSDKALINYFTAPNEVYILCITKEKAEVKKIIAGNNYREALQVYVSENFNFSEGRRYNGYQAAQVLYGYLISPVIQQIKAKSQLIIIPDGNLFQLPFDGLIQSTDTKSFLMRSHAISYHYSIALLLHQKQAPKTVFDQKNILAFAPFANAYPSIEALPHLPVLPYSKSEINQPGATQILNEKATKVKFLKSYDGYHVLHLATHANLGSDSSNNWIQFAPSINGEEVADKLYVQDIYNLDLSANDLIILSACESGNGQLAGGEGLLSLSRAFLYAGARGIVSTLYKTDDFVTAYIIKRLYHHMQAGKDPPEALRLSKIDFLEDDEVNVRLKKPVYWSNLVFIGEMSKPKDAGIFKASILLAIIILATLGSLWFINKTISK